MKPVKSIDEAYQIIFQENTKLMESIHKEEVEKFLECIMHTKGLLKSRNIFLLGEGRSGLVAKAFAMRLMHLDFRVFVVGETTTPSVRKGDLLIACSGSGETEVVCHMVQIAKENGAVVVSFTGKPASRLASVSGLVVEIPAAIKGEPEGPDSGQFSGSLFEQGLFLLFEAIVLVLMGRTKKTFRDLQQKHANLE